MCGCNCSKRERASMAGCQVEKIPAKAVKKCSGKCGCKADGGSGCGGGQCQCKAKEAKCPT